MTSFVFAYGSNMCSGRFRNYKVTPLGRGRSALLEDFILNFNKRSTDGSGKATILQSPGNALWGVLYEVPLVDLVLLDHGERGYVRESVTVLVDSQPVMAWVYIADRPDATMRLRPYRWYKRFLVEGAREHALPSDYIDRLTAIEDLIDPNQSRETQQMAIHCSRSDRISDEASRSATVPCTVPISR